MTRDHSPFSVFAALAVLIAGLLGGCRAEVIDETPAAPAPMTYASRLFDNSLVHTVDLRITDMAAFWEAAPREEYVKADVVIDGETFSSVGIRTKGNNSHRLITEHGLQRYSLKLEFDHYIRGATYHGLDKFSLDASFQDNSYMKTMLAMELMRQMGVPTPLTSYVWVTMNGEPWGLFVAIEEPEEAFVKRIFGEDHGLLYKPDYQRLSDENADVSLRYIDDDPQSYPNIFNEAKFPVSPADKERLIRALKTLDEGVDLETAINTDEVLRYFAVQVFVMNFDSYVGPTGHNYFLYEEDGILSILPWDYNLAFGTYPLAMSEPIRDSFVLINYPVFTPWDGNVMKQRPLFHHVMQNDSCFEQYRSYLDQLLTQYVENDFIDERIDAYHAMIAPYVQRDPTAFCSYERYLAAKDTLSAVCRLRGESVRGQLEGRYPSTLAQRKQDPRSGVNTSAIDLYTLGSLEDLRS